LEGAVNVFSYVTSCFHALSEIYSRYIKLLTALRCYFVFLLPCELNIISYWCSRVFVLSWFSREYWCQTMFKKLNVCINFLSAHICQCNLM